MGAIYTKEWKLLFLEYSIAFGKFDHEDYAESQILWPVIDGDLNFITSQLLSESYDNFTGIVQIFQEGSGIKQWVKVT